MANSENTITSAFVNVLRHMRETWSVNEQITNAFVFQSVLAGKPEMERVMSLKRMLSDNAKRLQYEQVIAGWDLILSCPLKKIFA